MIKNGVDIVRLFLFFALLLLLVLGCKEKSRDASESFNFDPVSGQFKLEAINIGSIVNVPSVRNAALLAAKQVNDIGGVLGKELNIIAFIAADAEHAVQQAEQLLKYDIKLMNVSFSSRSKAVSELTIAKKIPLISESATSTFFTDYDDDDYYFRLVPSDVIQSRILAELAREKGYQSAITVHNKHDQYGETLVEFFNTNFSELGGEVNAQLAVPFSLTQGFDHFLQIINDHNPDIILGAILDAAESANFVNEALAFGVQSQFLFPDASAGIMAFTNNLVTVDGVSDALGTAPGFGLATNEQMIYFTESYQQQFLTPADSFDVSAYDLVMITALAIEHAGLLNHTDDPSGEMVRNSLRAVMNPPGIKLGPANIAEALSRIRSGEAVDYSGSYGDNDWDHNGDIVGEITYNVMSLDSETKLWKTLFQQQVFIP